MPESSHSKPSFSPAKRWGIALQVGLIILIVFSVVVMVNFLGRDYFLRFRWNTHPHNPLSAHTVSFLHSFTNQVQVTVYYNSQDPFFSLVKDLLDEYKLVNPRIRVQVVDYLRDPTTALQLKDKYSLGSSAAKNRVIFDCDGRFIPVDGNALANYTIERTGNDQEPLRRRATHFLGESMFTAALLNVTSTKPLKAYFLVGHREHDIESDDETIGYLKFASLLKQNSIQVDRLNLLGTNAVPMDCNLLIVAGPMDPIPSQELGKIDQYLTQGGRLLALFNYVELRRGETGLEKLLTKWGVEVTNQAVRDPENTTGGADVVVGAFSTHPLVNPLQLSRLQLVLPRVVRKLNARTQRADAPSNVDEVAFSGPNAYIDGKSPNDKHAFPLIVTVENAIKGVITERGTTRIVVVGDSIFLANHQIDLGENGRNRDFAGYLANWLLDRTQLVQGAGPQQIFEYHLNLTKAQLQSAEIILLAAFPGAPLLIGGLVWLRRRK